MTEISKERIERAARATFDKEQEGFGCTWESICETIEDADRDYSIISREQYRINAKAALEADAAHAREEYDRGWQEAKPALLADLMNAGLEYTAEIIDNRPWPTHQEPRQPMSKEAGDE